HIAVQTVLHKLGGRLQNDPVRTGSNRKIADSVVGKRRRERPRTHGRGEIAWILGSVAEKVVSHAIVPVLLMRVIEPHPLMEKSNLGSQ
ncbi:MAG: hypothetical protein FJ139_11665, partial [Deltaproteobacteria bacterium]|nr:hypothetical protein [Deltaproteobacteria bacterium]